MNYDEATNFLFDLRRFQVDPGTDAVRALLSHLGDPHEDVTFVQVAGSNGKGSVTRMAASVLRQTDRTVGACTSPHFEDLRERVRVDGRKVPESAVTEFVETVRPWLVDRAAVGEPLTFFEVVTALALWRFGEADVDVAVLEAGMGGELDATSVVEPAAAAVTNVALEHTSVLGETRTEIAETFAPVAPTDRPLVTAADGDARETLAAAAGELAAVAGPTTADEPTDPVVTAAYDGATGGQESAIRLTVDGRTLSATLPLVGAYQATNAGVAVALVRQLGVDDETAIRRGLRAATWPGRFEVVETEPAVVLDGAHNPAACRALRETVDAFDHDRLHLVFGAMTDKDHREMVRALPSAATVRTCAPDSDRAADPAALARTFESETGATVTVGDGPSDRPDDGVVAALSAARAAAEPEDLVLLTGSLYCVAAARTEWTRTVTPRRPESVADATATLRAAHVPPAETARTAAETVHRTLETTLPGDRATTVRQAAATAGVTTAESGFDDRGRHRQVLLSGSVGDFRRLIDGLRERGRAFYGVADDLAAALPDDDGTAPSTTDGTDEMGTASATDATDEMDTTGATDGTDEMDTTGATGATDEMDTTGATDATDAYPWETGTAVMGVLNVTPDSFHDGGEHYDLTDAVAGAEELVAAGVDVIDVGGESTRPGAEPVPADEEIDRIVPVIEAVTDAEPDALVSVDTRKPAVAAAALDAGADVLNDVTGLEDPEMRALAAERDVPVIVMHSIDAPVVPDKEVPYDDVVDDVIAELREKVLLAEEAGVDRERVIVDPGLGFGKTAAESFELLGRLDEFAALGCPVLVGHSHKSMFEFVDGETGDALSETVAATALAARAGADLVRVHDARENVQAVRVAAAAADPAGFAERFDPGQ
ncbi:dihydropteroate synthase [Halobaculum sp. MBLA0143]|uniref:dihydropteroate synthase n=1 Tax=Halobaculum sp. MBLA0143 TaxID=3079933 RepID=UPI003525AEB9